MQTDELCTTDRSLCNIVAFIQRQTAKVVHDDDRVVQSVHVFKDGLHAEGLPRGREAVSGAGCTRFPPAAAAGDLEPFSAARSMVIR
jgi:hypothetical protein